MLTVQAWSGCTALLKITLVLALLILVVCGACYLFYFDETQLFLMRVSAPPKQLCAWLTYPTEQWCSYGHDLHTTHESLWQAP
jgi:hypothetical protein